MSQKASPRHRVYHSPSHRYGRVVIESPVLKESGQGYTDEIYFRFKPAYMDTDQVSGLRNPGPVMIDVDDLDPDEFNSLKIKWPHKTADRFADWLKRNPLKLNIVPGRPKILKKVTVDDEAYNEFLAWKERQKPAVEDGEGEVEPPEDGAKTRDEKGVGGGVRGGGAQQKAAQA